MMWLFLIMKQRNYQLLHLACDAGVEPITSGFYFVKYTYKIP